MFLTILSWIMSLIALTGTILNAQMKKEGFYFWIVSNLYLSYMDWKAGLYYQSLLLFIYFLLALNGLYNWNKKTKDSE